MRINTLDEGQFLHNEGITQKDKQIKTQDEGIVRTQCSNLEKMKLILKKQYNLQSLEVLPRESNQKNAPPTFDQEKKAIF